MFLSVLLLLVPLLFCFDRSKFEFPHKTHFYSSNFHYAENNSYFQLLPNITIHSTFVEGKVFNSRDNVTLSYQIQFFIHDIFRFTLLEEEASYLRKEVDGVLINQIKEAEIIVSRSIDTILFIPFSFLYSILLKSSSDTEENGLRR